MTATSVFQLASLDDLRRSASKVFSVWIWVHLPVIALIAWLNGTSLVYSLGTAAVIAALPGATPVPSAASRGCAPTVPMTPAATRM